MTLKVTCKARFAGRRSSSKCGGRDEMDGQPKGRECGMQSSQWSPRKRCDIDNAKRSAQPESREDRVNHFARGLDAIRDSRIAFKDGFRDTP
jgi:hypothetical protein